MPVRFHCRLHFLLSVAVCLFVIPGCAEGPLWRTGKYFPWVQNQWKADEAIAETIFSKRARLQELVTDAKANGPAAEDAAAKELQEIIKSGQIHLLKIEAANLLPQLSTDSAVEALEMAALDRSADVRAAAISGLKSRAMPRSASILAQVAQNDKNLDVRLAAIRALSAFNNQAAMKTLDQSLNDNNPAVQVAAMDSLEMITGQSLERDINQWRDYLAQRVNAETPQTANSASGTNRVR